MKNRSYQLSLKIDDGLTRRYAVRPLPAAQLATPFVWGFSLTELTQNPHPVYRVLLAADGAINCTCPQWNKAETCKHADCLRAAGLLPVEFVLLLKARTALLDAAEAKLAEVSQRALHLQSALEAQLASPRRRTRKAKAA
ncbi:MAG TPA: hypothetical protein VH643_28995 [Gemmataceae bacterium]|jgi:hypothetical protein